MPIRKSRFIPSPNAPYDLLNVYFTKDEIVVRLLVRDPSINPAHSIPAKHLYSLEKLHMRTIEHNGEHYGVLHEAFYNKNDKPNRRSWGSFANIVCLCSDKNDQKMFFCDKSEQTFIKRWRTNWFIEFHNYVLPFQMFVLDSRDGIDEVSKSFAARRIEDVITNMDLRNVLYHTPEAIAANSELSHYFQPKLHLTAPETCKPEETFWVDVEATNAEGEHIDINYHFEIAPMAGYAPHKRVDMVDGRARFRITALGLFDGEEIRVKFGRKISPSLAECIVKVRS